MNRRRHRPALIAFVLVGAAVCLLLGWWQWSRFESSSGTAQNLGYAMQWPLFAAAFIWGYRRFVQLEDESELADRLAAGEDLPETTTPVAAKAVTALPDGFLPARRTPASASTSSVPTTDDDAHREYNRLLAELAATDTPRSTVEETQ